MKYIIMCGGKYDAWSTPRQLTEISGEPIVMRTIRLLRESGVTDIAISTSDERFAVCGVPLLQHDNEFTVHGKDNCDGTWVNCFYPMDEPCCYLMGDVVFSPEAIRTIVETKVWCVEFFASAPPFDERYIKRYAEPFAFKVANQKVFRQAVKFVKMFHETTMFDRPPIAWELWQVIRGEPVNDIDYESYVAINDYTCDIDKEEDVRKLKEVLDGQNTDTRLSEADVVC